MVTESQIRNLEPGITVVEISGRLNLGNTLISIENSLRRLIGEGVRKLVVDLKGLDHIDSSGIGMLVGCNGTMEQNGGRMRIAGARDAVSKAFEVVHMERVVPLDPDVDISCERLSAGGTAV